MGEVRLTRAECEALRGLDVSGAGDYQCTAQENRIAGAARPEKVEVAG